MLQRMLVLCAVCWLSSCGCPAVSNVIHYTLNPREVGGVFTAPQAPHPALAEVFRGASVTLASINHGCTKPPHPHLRQTLGSGMPVQWHVEPVPFIGADVPRMVGQALVQGSEIVVHVSLDQPSGEVESLWAVGRFSLDQAQRAMNQRWPSLRGWKGTEWPSGDWHAWVPVPVSWEVEAVIAGAPLEAPFEQELILGMPPWRSRW